MDTQKQKTSTNSMVRSFTEQYDRLWSSMRDAISKCPDEVWRNSEVDWLVPSRLAFHAIQACDFYSSHNRDGFDWDKFGCNWETSKPDELPTRERTLEYQSQVADHVKTWLSELGDDGLLEEEKEFPWTGKLVMDRAIYSLRHAQHHLGQINAELRHHDLPRGKWA